MLRLCTVTILSFSLIALLTACGNGGTQGPDGPGGSTGGTTIGTQTSEVIPPEEWKRVLVDLEDHLNQHLSPQMTVSWRVPLDKAQGIRAAWLLDSELVIENRRRELWSIQRKPGNIAWSFSLDPNNDSPDRYVIRRPARSDSYIHIVCSDGVVYTVDEFGNLEYQCQLDFEPSSDPTGTDQHLLIGADTGRFFYAWDVFNNRYDKRRRLDEICGSRPVSTNQRLYFADNSGNVHALSLDRADFFERVWSKSSFSEVESPLVLNKEAAQLYVATKPDGVVTCYSTHSGAILWSRPTECEISEELVADTRYYKDRVYAITENNRDDPSKNGLWAIKSLDPAAGKEGDVLWTFPGANKILALGKEHIYVRTGAPGSYKIAIVRTSDGTKEREFAVKSEFDQWFTNPFGPQIIIGANYKNSVGLFLSVTEPE